MTNLKALLWALVVWLCCFSYSNAQTAPDGTEYIQDSVDFSFGSENWDPPDSVTELTIGDDQRASVPLDFGFPLGQRLYTHSWMHSNGVVTFMSTFNWMCCNGLDLENYSWNQTTEPYFNHMIAPLWTDTINTNVDIDGDGIDDSGHYTESYEYDDGTESQRYFWRNVAEYYNNNALNSFALEIYDTGKVDIWHFEIDIRQHDIFVGAVQDFQNDDDPVKGILFHDRSVDGAYTFTAEDADEAKIWSGTPFDIYPSQCNTNPLYSAECPGYAEALFQQQCDANALYDSSCPGYATAYYNQQCSANALYDSGCPGYQQAYYNQQCTQDPLYDSGCPGYETAYYNQQCTANPLYDSGCPGYAEAYYDQQCTADPLYDTGCPGYQTAYYNQQCSLDPLYAETCPGYETAYYNQQCTADPLYDSGCPGYATAYYDQQCSLDGLYDTGCPNYETAYNANQCSLNPLYLPSCTGYAAALAEQEASQQTTSVVVVEEDYSEPDIIDDPVIDDVVFSEPEIELIEISEPEPLPVIVPEIVVVEVVEEVVVEPTIEEQIESEIEPQAPEPEPVEEEIAFNFSIEENEEEEEVIEEPVIEEEVDEEENTETESSDNVDEQVDNEGNEESDEPQERDAGEAEPDTERRDQPGKQESKREKVKKLLAAKASELANDLAAAQTLEEQQRIQNEIFAIQNFNYEFKGYSVGLGYDNYIIPDSPSPASGNRRGLLNGLAQEVLHQKMVDMQWNR